MKSWDVRNVDKKWGVWRGKIDYSKVVDGIPYLSSARFWNEHHENGETKPRVQDWEGYEVLSLSQKALPIEKFTLSAFGIPEIGQNQAKSRLAWWFWYANAALFVLIVIVLWRRTFMIRRPVPKR